MKTNKASVEVGGAIIVVAVLLLLFGIFIDGDSPFTTKKDYKDKKASHGIEDSYLFKINNTELGRQQKVTQTFPNIILGSRTSYTDVFRESLIELRSNPFYQSEVSFTVSPDQSKDIDEFLLYASPTQVSGNAPLEIHIEDERIGRYKNTGSSYPIPLRNLPDNESFEMTLSLEKPFFLNLFSWNRAELNDVRFVEVGRDADNKKREFNFQIENDFLESVSLDLMISCEGLAGVSPAIKVDVNGYIITNENPNCQSRQTIINADIPLNILKNKNTLTLETNGFYTLAYSIQSLHFNDRQTYSFSITSFEDIIDVVMYGEFDREVIDIRLNSHSLELNRNEVKSIIPYLRFGTNEITFQTKPLEIKDFTIEKNRHFKLD